MSRFLVATTGHTVPLSGGETYVGTDPAVQIPVRGDMGLMPRHFVIAPNAGGWQLAAFEGAVVLVNGLQVRSTEIHDGDQIVAGELALTYRDEQEAAMAQAAASMSQNSFPSLHLSLPQNGGESEEPSLSRPPLPPSLSEDFVTSSGSQGTVSGRSGGIGLLLCGVLLMSLGGMLLKKAYEESQEKEHAPKPKRLMADDLIFLEGRVGGGGFKPRKEGEAKAKADDRITCIYGGYFAREPGGRKDLRDLGRMDLPDDLPYDDAWSKPDNVAKFGFLKTECIMPSGKPNASGVHTYMPGPQSWRNLITLEVDGKVYRSLAMINAPKKTPDTHLMYGYGGGILAAVGLLLLLVGWENGRARKAVI